MPRSAVRTVALMAAGCFALTAHAAQSPSLEQILKSGASYIAEYEQRFSAVVSEEVYRQRAIGELARQGPDQRLLKSDLLLIEVRGGGWVTFRDVFEVDGERLRDRSDRLVDLILKPSPDAFEQVERINQEGARFNVGRIERTLNTPALALMFLRADTQARSRFRLVRTTKVDGQPAAEVEFIEVATPRMVRTVDDAPASGRFWLDPQSGRVLKTELTMVSGGSRARILVSYRMQERIGLMTPVAMEESYDMGDAGTVDSSRSVSGVHRIEGYASYSNFRSFNVDTSTFIKK
jgi:hypothetical protein